MYFINKKSDGSRSSYQPVAILHLCATLHQSKGSTEVEGLWIQYVYMHLHQLMLYMHLLLGKAAIRLVIDWITPINMHHQS